MGLAIQVLCVLGAGCKSVFHFLADTEYLHTTVDKLSTLWFCSNTAPVSLKKMFFLQVLNDNSQILRIYFLFVNHLFFMFQD